jgi:uncharacterized protein YjdB
MKIKMMVALVSLLTMIALVSCGDPAASTPFVVDSVSLSASQTTGFDIGESLTLDVSVNGSRASGGTQQASSSDQSIATVSDAGVVQFLRYGNVTITVTVTDDTGHSESDVIDLTVDKDHDLAMIGTYLNNWDSDIGGINEYEITFFNDGTVQVDDLFNAITEMGTWSTTDTNLVWEVSGFGIDDDVAYSLVINGDYDSDGDSFDYWHLPGAPSGIDHLEFKP